VTEARLKNLRAEIDRLDDEILSLLNRRAQAVIEVGKIKSERNLRFYVPEREVEILRRISAGNPGPFPNDALKAVYREIISASLALEKPLSVAFLGPRATFTHLACLKHFGESAVYIPQINVSEVFDAVERDVADFGVVPIENSSEGIVSNTLDMFVDHNLLISGEILVEVAHDLLSVTGDLEHVRKVYSHPHAISQCRGGSSGTCAPSPYSTWRAPGGGGAGGGRPVGAAIAGRRRPRSTASEHPEADPGQHEQLYPFHHHREDRAEADRQRQDVDPVRREGRGRGPPSYAGAVREVPGQPHQDRIPARQDKGVGIPLLPRHGGAHLGRAGGEGRGRAPDAGPILENPGILSPGHLTAPPLFRRHFRQGDRRRADS
jgi:chorismate mutase-like protein